MNSTNTATEEKMPPTKKFAVCWKIPKRKPANDGAAIIAEPAERHRNEAVEVEQGTVGDESEQQGASGEAGKRTDRTGERIARHAQVALRQTQSLGSEVVLGNGEEGPSHQRIA